MPAMIATAFQSVLAVLMTLASAQTPAPAQAAGGPPPTEVFLAPLSIVDGKMRVGAPENISKSPGYDNQPHFSPDGRVLFFTSARGSLASKCGNPQTDVYRLDLQSRAVARVTETTDCEYSPTVTPDGKHLSVIQVEPDGTQRLWRFTLDGRNPVVVLADVKPVGYHAWLDEKTLALFVLGQPPTLQIADVGTGKAEVIATGIGQSIQKIPAGGISFVQQAGEREQRTLTITQLTLAQGKPITTPLTPAVAGATQAHVAWTPEGTLLMAHDGSLHAWRPDGSGWRVVADLGALGLRNVTRLAVSPEGDKLALVATPQ